MRFYTNEQLGRTQSLTPEGFLLISDVPLARVGALLYADGEVPVDAGPDGIIRVLRDPEEVFHPIAIASFAGKPVTNEHPPVKVSPENWRDYSVGVVLDPRRGDGIQYDNDFLFADLLITDKEAIKDVREGKRQVSAGYDAEYEQIRPGEGRQHQIVGNHVALVDKGRCGPRCSIGDKHMASFRKSNSWADRIMQAHRTGDDSALVEELEKVGEMLGEVLLGDEEVVDPKEAKKKSEKGEPVTDAKRTKDKRRTRDEDEEEEEAEGGSSAIMKRLEALERAVAILAQEEESEGESSDRKGRTKDEDEDEDEDKKKKSESKDRKRTADEKEDDDDEDEDKKKKSESKDKRASVGDSSSLRVTWQELISRAEFLAPGIKHPTFDSKLPVKVTQDAMCAFRRKVLTEALKEEDTKAAIEQVVGDTPDVKRMTCDSVTLVYNGASEMMRQSNSRQASGPVEGMNYTLSPKNTVDMVVAINKRNREKYGLRA